MNAAAALDDDRDAELQRLSERVSLLEALVRLASDRIATLEGAGPEIDRGFMMTPKMAGHVSGYSQSAIRKMVRQGRVDSVWIGGRVFLTSLPERRR